MTYGSTETSSRGSSPRARASERVRRSKTRPDWAYRGSTWFILITLGSGIFSHAVFVVAIWEFISGQDKSLFFCDTKKTFFKQRGQMEFCWYISSYIECFPEFTVAMAVLLAARNLLQLRLYYTMLDHDAVILYTSKRWWKDWLLRIYMWCWGNLVVQCLFISRFLLTYGTKAYLAGVELDRGFPNDDWFRFLGYHAPSSDWNRVLSLVGMIVIPTTLFVVFLSSAYDIELKLLPLSQYFHDAREHSPDRDWHPDATATLVCMTDTAAKALVDSCYEDLVRRADSVSELVGSIIEKYRLHGEKFEAETVHERLQLSGSLWPASLLATNDAAGLSEDLFRCVYIWYTIAASIICFGLAGTMVMYSVEDSGRMSGAFAALSMIVVWAQIGLVGFIGFILATSLCSCCIHPIGARARAGPAATLRLSSA